MQQMQQMQAQIQQLSAALQHQQQQQQQQAAAAAAAAAAAPAAAPSIRRAKIPAASNFSGTASMLDGWLREMKQQYDWYQYTADAEQVAMAAAQLRGTALDWWSALNAAELQTLRASFPLFEQALRARFQPVNSAQTARLALDCLRQGAKQSVADYTSAFRRLLVSVPDMSEADKVHRFVQGLRGHAQQQLIVHGVDTLDKAISMAARVGSLGLFAASSAAAAGYSQSSNGSAMDVSALGLHAIEGLEPETDVADDDDAAAPVTRSELQKMHRQLLLAMQQHRSGAGNAAGNRGGKRPASGRGPARGPPRVPGLTDQQVRERLDGGLCFVCGEPGHRKFDCPQNKQKNQSGN